MPRFFLFLPINLFILLSFCSVKAQQGPDEFTVLSDSILAVENASYRNFDQLLTPLAKNEFLLQRLIEKSEKSENPIGVSYGYNQLGKLNARRFNYSGAIEYHKNALEIAREKKQPLLQMTTLNLLGSSSLKIDSIKNALMYHQEVIRMVNAMDNPNQDYQREWGKAYYGLGTIYHALGRYVLATEHYKTAIEHFEKASYPEGLAFASNASAESFEAAGKLEEALSFYEKSTRANQQANSERLKILNTVGIAHVLVHQDQGEESAKLVGPLLMEPNIALDQELHTLLHLQYGWILLNVEEFNLAEEYLSKGLEMAKQLNITNYIYDGYTWLHDLWKEQGDYEKALNYYEIAQGTRRKIINRRNLQLAYDVLNISERERNELQMQMLSRENEIVNLRLRRNQTTLLIGALVTVLIGLILYMAYRQYQTNNEKRVMALEQSRLRSQMNPHFLFNSLNSIKHYIINNEQKNAVHYLNKFSKLVRRILESTSIKENSLQEELKTVELYMDIENIRFNEQIDFEVDIAPDINPHNVKIPSLILQPFLENALWHGLSSKEGEKKIRLEVRRNEKGFINIAIRDNGIGREASEKLREGKVLKRTSMGISITRKRLSNFSRIYKNTFDLSIEDLYHGDGMVAGTQVNLKIPMI